MDEEIKLCTREGNRCPKRLKCLRYTLEPDPTEKVWYMDYWYTLGKECKNQIKGEK